MPDFEELKLTVNLVDNASTGIASIRTQLTQLSQQAGQVNTAFSQVATSVQQVGNAAQQASPKLSGHDKALKELNRSAEETGRGLVQMALNARRGMEAFPGLALSLRETTQGLKGISEGMAELAPSMRLAVVGFGGFVVGITAVGAALAAYGISVFKFGQEMYRLSQTARSLGMTFASLKTMTDQNAAFGISVQQTTAQLAQMQSALADLSVSGSQLRQQMLGMGIPAQRIDQIVRETDAIKRQNMIRQDQIKIFDDLQKRMGTEAAREWANRYAKMWGADPTAMDRKPLEAATKEELEALEKIEKYSRVIGEQWAEVRKKIADIKDEFLAWGLPAIVGTMRYIKDGWDAIGRSIHAVNELLGKVGTSLAGIAKVTIPGLGPLLALAEKLRGKGGEPEAGAGAEAGAPPPEAGAAAPPPASAAKPAPKPGGWGWAPEGLRQWTRPPASPSNYRGDNDNIHPLLHQASFGGDGFNSGVGGSSGEGRAQAIIKSGVYEALIDFSSYVQTGGSRGGGGGIVPASYSPGGGGGAASFGGGGSGAAGFGGGGYSNLTPGVGGNAVNGGVPDYTGRRRPAQTSSEAVGSAQSGVSAADAQAIFSGGNVQGTVPAGQTGGAGAGSSGYLAGKRAGFAKELEDPATRKLLGAVISSENPGAGPAVAESLMNRTELVNESRARRGLPPLRLRDMILGQNGAPGGGKSFYGPVRSGAINEHLRKMNNPAFAAQMNQRIDAALGGSNTVAGYTDQGSAGDPNYIKGGVGVNINRERFNDWGYAGSAAWRQRRQAEVAAAAGNEASPVAKVGGYPSSLLSMRESQNAPIGLDLDRAALDRGAIDRQNSSTINSTGKLSVDVKAPPGSKVDYTGNNLLAPTSMQRQTQMLVTDTGPSVGDTARSFMRGGS
jgi:hypothetical protein